METSMVEAMARAFVKYDSYKLKIAASPNKYF
jgi:hypothetical protein